MTGIYKITSPSGKIYIGQSINIEDRIKSYKYVGHRKNQHKLNNSISKHGLENHIFEIIEECSLDQLDEREIYWISYYKCVEEGLNLTYGGEGGKHSDETKIKKSKSMSGKTHSKETKHKMSQTKIGHLMYTDEWKSKMSQTAWISGTSSKPIHQYTKEMVFIKEWKSASEAARHLKKEHSAAISECCLGKRKTAYGYKWEYKN
jgi:group I intron endonuclease